MGSPNRAIVAASFPAIEATYAVYGKDDNQSDGEDKQGDGL